jgi:site-specific recombinase XerD
MRAKKQSRRSQGHPDVTADEMRWLKTEAERLIDGLERKTVANLRDRAIIGIMGYTQAPVDAVIAMRVRDYYSLGDRRWVRLQENGAERYEIIDRRLEHYIDEYVAAAAIAGLPRTPLFRATLPGNRLLGTRSMRREHILLVIKGLTERLASQRSYTIIDSQISNQLLAEQFDKLIESINGNSVINRRDRAIIGIMLYASLSPTFISTMLTSHYTVIEDRDCIKLDNEDNPIAASPPLAKLMQEYLEVARPRRVGRVPLFKVDRIRPMTVLDIEKMLRLRKRQARLQFFEDA